MRSRSLLLGGLSIVALVLVFAFNNCSSQKGPSAIDQALNSSSTGTGNNNNNNNTGVSTGDSAIPAGAIMPMAISSCPTGWIAADGSAQLRSAFTKLFAAIGTTYGAGDGSTTFTIPDYRGYFLRGVDGGSGNDPQAPARTDRGDGTLGDTVGSKQAQGTAVNGLSVTLTNAQGYSNGSGWGYGVNNVAFGAATATVSSSDVETRPKNIAVLYCISTGGQ